MLSIVVSTTISITNRWQIHIPKALRSVLSLEKPGKVEITAQPGKLIIKPAKSKIMQLAGKYEKYAKHKKINLDKIRDYIDYSNL